MDHISSNNDLVAGNVNLVRLTDIIKEWFVKGDLGPSERGVQINVYSKVDNLERVRGHTPAKNVEIKVLEKDVSSVLRDNYGKKNRFTYF